MEAHHGFIDLESSPGQGAQFSLFFPVVEDDETAEHVQLIVSRQLVGRPGGPEPDEAEPA